MSNRMVRKIKIYTKCFTGEEWAEVWNGVVWLGGFQQITYLVTSEQYHVPQDYI